LEAITRLVADSLARHGLDRPVDPRRLQWSRWFLCDSTHSLLVVPSKPGIFAIAEEVMDLGAGITPSTITDREGHDFSPEPALSRRSAPKELPQRRMLAVLQFSEDDDMAFVLDRMFTRVNPMRSRLASRRCFLRFVVIEDQDQRRSICNALNQWLLSSSEKATGIAADFQSSLELTTDHVGRTLPSAGSEPALSLPKGQALSDSAASIPASAQAPQPIPNSDFLAPKLDSGANKNLHCPHPLPSGF
jgi:hypothetical protein